MISDTRSTRTDTFQRNLLTFVHDKARVKSFSFMHLSCGCVFYFGWHIRTDSQVPRVEKIALSLVIRVSLQCLSCPQCPTPEQILHTRGHHIYVKQACSQRLLSPQLRMVFDDNMRASAKVLALHSFMDGGMHGPGAGMGRGNDSGGSSSLHRMGALQESLVSDVEVALFLYSLNTYDVLASNRP